MKIRSITYFINPHWPFDESALLQAGDFIAVARPAFEAAGYTVQTTRLATIPFPRLLYKIESDSAIELGTSLENIAQLRGYDYVSLGPALPEVPTSFALIPQVLATTENVFMAGSMTTSNGSVSLTAVRACAEIISETATISPDGFANLRFAALAKVPPGAPFFPAAYHEGDNPTFALATEAADLAVETFNQAPNLAEARQRLVKTIETHAQALHKTANNLSCQFDLPFSGIDFTLASFPQEALSFGHAMEQMGLPAVGLHGSLAAAAILADTLDRASFQHTGFNGLMLPVLEDAILASRSAVGQLTIKDLLLYSAVCGTGLDTIPLAGDTSAEALYALLLDLATLSQRLSKPLTARLMPLPGKKVGDPTDFDFPYFTNSRVMALDAQPLLGLLEGEDTFNLIQQS